MSSLWLETSTSVIEIEILYISSILFIVIFSWRSLILLNLKLSSFIHQVSTCYTDNHNNSNSVIDLLFLQLNSVEINNHFILPDSQHPLDLSQIRYSLVVILELNGVSEVQYKDVMINRWWKVSTGIINVVKSKV